MEVFPLVAPGLSHLPDVDHVEHDVADVGGLPNAPGRQHGGSEIAVLLQAVEPGRLAEFLARNVPLDLAAATTAGLRPGIALRLGRDRRGFEVFGRGLLAHPERLLGERQ